jgi:putative phosphoserine phosphatase/1-acylglycerol-3-phosphate O-acyltransferase
VARDLGIAHVLCTELVAENGILTGQSHGMLWGEAKAKAVRAFAREHGVDLRASSAYANGQEDVAFLSSVGHAHALNPHPVLRQAAADYGWPVIMLREPPETNWQTYARTLGMHAAMNTGFGIGAALGLLRRDRRFGSNTGLALGSDAALKAARISLNVIGEDNLWRARPAVFIFNHQSALDPILFGALLRRDFTAVAKKEAKHDPRVALINFLLETVFVDRGNTTQSRRELDALVERIRGGTSIAIAPEGTRTATPKLQPFKKGAFHMAMQAGVPIVPVVVRNAGELWFRGDTWVHPGTADVCVLDPIPTGDWTVESLGGHVSDIRQRFIDVLEQWPAMERA